MLGKAVSRVRGELGESLPTVQKFDVPLEQATTSSLEALKAYSLGHMSYAEKGAGASLPHFQRAIDLDPNFAMGYWAVGGGYQNLGEVGRASEYLAKAFQLREYASEREKLVITAGYYFNVTGELDKAAQTYQELIETYPHEYSAYNDLGVIFGIRGQYEKATELAKQALPLGPNLSLAYENLAYYALAMQRFDETRRIVHQAQAGKMDGDGLHSQLYALAFLGADSGAMAEQQQWFASHAEYQSEGLGLASDTEAYAGHVRKARELTKRDVESALRADNKEGGAGDQAIAGQWEAAYGNAAEGRRLAQEALKLAPTSRSIESEAALAFAMAGDTARAESLTQDLGKRFPLDTRRSRFGCLRFRHNWRWTERTRLPP